MTGSKLHMLRFEIDERRLREIETRKHFGGRRVDQGYLVHSALGETFGEGFPAPFRVEGSRGGRLQVLAYATGDPVSYQERSKMPGSFVTPGTVQGREMPVELPVGTVLEFGIRCCPVVRVENRERDAYLSAVEKKRGDSREEVYAWWLRTRLECAGARVMTARLDAWTLAEMTRRDGGRQPRGITLPDAIFSGTLEIVDSVRFDESLRRGIGRHCSFGFGMLTLRKAA